MILVTGAKGVVGRPLCERLQGEGEEYIAVTRSAPNFNQELQWDLSKPPSTDAKVKLGQVTSVIHCAPIWLLPLHVDFLLEANVTQLVVFSSTSVISKQASKNPQEQQLVAQLGNAEQQLISACESTNTKLIILRPSLIYGYGRDQNVSHIAGFIKRFHFMVLVGKASGLRQPVHADDLVDTAIAGLSALIDGQRIYTLAGKEVLTYRSMVKRIFEGLRKKPIMISIPLWVFRSALAIAAKVSGFSYTAEMAERMNQNLDYDYIDASKDLSFHPQAFLEKPERDLKL